ncbi:hypothetical protein GGTG_00987 [Gaeumannomyces tritici R3-111a-1]|uniref:Uncharacterized protein n=1 Tax=Gaeumannomyces tritici (strain R3-111a-1) TaxID=644352 RepID=J3NIA4_GAET3|nr:hypothetical protein GGTG_00987 [Gaeumannomyces tritici R3-111a-1]EJT80997.1 hypothetical protein GGTG_00987 [Gaeumannomyces tritici R3-111a-1]
MYFGKKGPVLGVGGVGYNGIIAGFGAVGNRSAAYGAVSAASSRAESAFARGHMFGGKPGARNLNLIYNFYRINIFLPKKRVRHI